jgi:iron(III) transport system substrate-binding protein
MEYPVNEAVLPHADVRKWGAFKPSTVNLARAGELQARAVRLMDIEGYK